MATEELTMTKLYQLLKESQEEQTRKIAQEIQKGSEKIKLDLNKLEKRCENLERAKRKNNIVVFGIKPTENLLGSTLSEINRLLELSLKEEDINNIYYIGKQEKRGIVVEFVSFLKKISIFKNIRNLKGTNVAIANDLSPEDRKINKILLKHLKKARGKNLSARIKGNYLEIDNKKYTAQELESGVQLNSDISEGETEEEETSQEETREKTPKQMPKKSKRLNKISENQTIKKTGRKH